MAVVRCVMYLAKRPTDPMAKRSMQWVRWSMGQFVKSIKHRVTACSHFTVSIITSPMTSHFLKKYENVRGHRPRLQFLSAIIAQESQHIIVFLFLRPRVWSRPRLRVRFNRVRASFEQQFYQFNPAPSACPAERSASQQIVAKIEAGACIEESCREGDALFRHHVFARPGDAMQDRQSELS